MQKTNKCLHRHAMNALLSHQHSSKSPRSDNENVPAKLAKPLRKKKKNRSKDWLWLSHSSHGLLNFPLSFVLFFPFRLKWNLGPSYNPSGPPVQSSAVSMSPVLSRPLMELGQSQSRQNWNAALWQGALPSMCWVRFSATLKKKKMNG